MNEAGSTNNSTKSPDGGVGSSAAHETQELNLVRMVQDSGLKLSEIEPSIYEMFMDKKFVASIPESIRNNPKQLALWLRNSSLFHSMRYKDDIRGEEIIIPETRHADGRIRREELGYELLINKVRELGIDPAGVLYFRRTQPTENMGNPEHYWTSDYQQTVSGLGMEISGEARESSIILCSTLGDISSDSKLMRDINDDDGFAVRRVNQASYDQTRVLFTIKP